MRAIILSAGQGSRLLPLTADRPKCLVEFAGKTLLDWQLDMLAANGVEEAVIVVGFRDDQVEAALARRSGGPRVTTLFNPFYKVADNLGSVWIAREMLDGDCLTLNGDTLVSRALVAKVLAAGKPGIAVTVDEKADGQYDADDMKVVRDADGRLRQIGKRLGDAPVNAESIGFIVYRGDGAARFRAEVEAMLRTPEGTGNWYLKAIHALAQHDRIDTVSIKGEEWGEVDFPEDLARAEELARGWVG
jgi:choline kinase